MDFNTFIQSLHKAQRLFFLTGGLLFSSPSFSIGSIVFDQEALKGGISWNASSISEADRIALGYCKASNCKVLTNFADQCIALAAGTNGAYGYKKSISLTEAKKVAIETCKKYEGVECSIFLSHCDPEPTQAIIPPVSKPPAAVVKPQATNSMEAKRQKCIRLGLAPGTNDFAQCLN